VSLAGLPVDIIPPRGAVVRFCVCACDACVRGDHLNCPESRCVSRTMSLRRVETINRAIVEHAFPWCRARLLHALGAAEEQGILEDVLSELLGDDAEIDHVRKHLRRHGWVK
jgi:hypothetical protein